MKNNQWFFVEDEDGDRYVNDDGSTLFLDKAEADTFAESVRRRSPGVRVVTLVRLENVTPAVIITRRILSVVVVGAELPDTYTFEFKVKMSAKELRAARAALDFVEAVEEWIEEA